MRILILMCSRMSAAAVGALQMLQSNSKSYGSLGYKRTPRRKGEPHGMDFQCSVRLCAAVLATGGFIDANFPKVNGAVHKKAVDETNNHSMAAIFAMINRPGEPLEAQRREHDDDLSDLCFRESQPEFHLLIAPAWIRDLPEVCASCVCMLPF